MDTPALLWPIEHDKRSEMSAFAPRHFAQVQAGAGCRRIRATAAHLGGAAELNILIAGGRNRWLSPSFGIIRRVNKAGRGDRSICVLSFGAERRMVFMKTSNELRLSASFVRRERSAAGEPVARYSLSI